MMHPRLSLLLTLSLLLAALAFVLLPPRFWAQRLLPQTTTAHAASPGAATPLAEALRPDGTLQATADLVVTKQIDLEPATPGIQPASAANPIIAGNTFQYLITLTNNGPSAAQPVSLADTLPVFQKVTNIQVVQTPDGNGSPNFTCAANPPVGAPGNTASVTCTAAELPSSNPSNTVTFILTVLQDPLSSQPTPTTYQNCVTTMSPLADPNPANNTNVCISVPLGFLANLTGAKTDGTDPVVAGNTLTYTITATSTGPSAALNMRITDALPPGTVFLSVTFSAGAIVTTPAVTANGTVTASWLGLTPPGVTRTLTIVVRICPDFQQIRGLTDAQMCVENLTNTASISSNTPGAAGTATALTTVRAVSDVSITMNGPTSATPGSVVFYPITISNAGPSNATGTLVADTLPNGFTVVGTPTSTVPGTTFTITTDANGVTTVVANLGVIGAANQCQLTQSTSGTITIVAQVPNKHPCSTVTNSASISTSNCAVDPNLANNTASLNTRIICPSSTITVNSLADTATAGDGQCTLREALTNTLGGDFTNGDCAAGGVANTINFNVTGTINLTSALPSIISGNVTINGPGPSLLEVHRSTGGNYRIFQGSQASILSISGLTITNGNGTPGGGVSCFGTLTINNCVISGNTADNGGGVFVAGSLVMTNSTLSGNTANSQGGGLNLQGSTATLTNCTISGNTANGSGSGGGITNLAISGQPGSLTLTNCTVTGNTGAAGGGVRTVAFTGSTSSAMTQLKNTLVAANTGPNFFKGATNASLNSLGNNLDSDGTSLFTNGVNGDIVGTSGSPIDARLGPLANYGGPTPTHALLCGSPALNAGNNAGAPATDQRGIARPVGGTVDIGAFEANIGLSPATLPSGTLGASYSQSVMASGGTPSYTFSLLSGALPSGLVLNANGLLSGTPTQSGSFDFTIKATDAVGFAGACSYTLTVGTCPTLSITPATLPNGRAGTAYNQTITQTGGTGTVNFSISVGALPSGLALSTGGGLSGTPTVNGTFNFTVRATDQNNCTGERAYMLLINPLCTAITVNPATLPNGFVGTAYSQTLTATGGTAPHTFMVTPGSLPNGLTLASGGALTGAPTTAGTFNFTVTATDNTGCTGTRAYTVIISGNGLQFFPLPQPVRLLETRVGFSGCTMPGVPINANGTLMLPARTACAGIPANAAAVTGNITVVPTGPGFLTLFPSTAAQPTVANSNFQTNEITNNVFTVGLGAGDGAFKIFSSATTHVIVDVTGYYAPPGTGGLYFHPLATPVRLLETRPTFTGCSAPGTPLTGTGDPNANPNLDLSLQGRSPVAAPCNSIPATAQVLVGNATSVLPTGGGYLTIYPSGGTRPTVASSNYAGSDVINGPFAVKLGTDGKFKIYTFATTHLVVDILGYYSEDALDVNGAGLLFNPLPSPVRLLETRPDFPGFPLTGCTRTNAPIAGNISAATHTQMAANFCGLPAAAQAIVGNVSVVNTTGAGFLTLFPANLTTAPLVATSNYPASATFGYNRHYFVGLSPADGKFKVLTQFTTDLILDASGYFAP